MEEIKEKKNVLQSVAEAINNNVYQYLFEDAEKNIAKDISDMIKSGHKNYDLFDIQIETNVFFKVYEKDLSALSIIAEKAPQLLSKSELKEFMRDMYSSGYGFDGYVKVMEAVGVEKSFLAEHAAENLENDKVTEWVMGNWEVCKPFRKEIARLARKLKLKNLEILASRSRCGLLKWLLAFGIGFVAGLVAMLFLFLWLTLG